MFTNRETVQNNLQAIKFENRLHTAILNLNEVDTTGEIELEERLKDIGIETSEHIQNFKDLPFDDQIEVVEALIQRQEDLKAKFPTSTNNADLIRRLKALYDFMMPEKPRRELPVGGFHPDTDTGTIADALGVNEDEVIAAIHNTPQVTSPHDTIDAWLESQDFVAVGQAATGAWADQFAKNLSPHEADLFFEIRNNDPARRKFAIIDSAIVVRKNIDGAFFDLEYPIEAEITELIQSLRK